MASVPRHVGVIMDGNRRFSKRLMAKPWKGHEWGAKKLTQLIEWCQELGVAELTVYAFSVQNFERPAEEFDALMRIFRESAEKLSAEIDAGKHADVRVVFIGRLGMFPLAVRSAMQALMDKTAGNNGFRVNIAMGYGGREEVLDAVRRIGEQVRAGTLDVDAINEDVFSANLYMDSEPDLVIRTGGERRTSNFLIWQSHYSEWFFLEKLWPEFEKDDFITVLEQYASRDRRFGK